MNKIKVTLLFFLFCSRCVTRITDTAITSGTHHVGPLRAFAPTSLFYFIFPVRFVSFTTTAGWYQPVDGMHRWCSGWWFKLVSGGCASFFVSTRRNSWGFSFWFLAFSWRYESCAFFSLKKKQNWVVKNDEKLNAYRYMTMLLIDFFSPSRFTAMLVASNKNVQTNKIPFPKFIPLRQLDMEKSFLKIRKAKSLEWNNWRI